MNVGYMKTIELSRSGSCILSVEVEMNHYFHTDYGVDRIDNVWNQDEGEAIRYNLSGGKFGSHSLNADDTNRKRLLAHWAGYCTNNGVDSNANFKVIKKINKKYWS